MRKNIPAKQNIPARDPKQSGGRQRIMHYNVDDDVNVGDNVDEDGDVDDDDDDGDEKMMAMMMAMKK
jgi:hypothetical protein